MFMLVDVPAPPWNTSMGKACGTSPSATRRQAARMASAFQSAIRPSSRLASSAASFTSARARATGKMPDGQAGYGEILHGARGLDPVKGRRRQADRAKEIALHPHCFAHDVVSP